MQYTSWEGILTKRLKNQGKLKGGYTRYFDRKARTGLQIVKNKEKANFIYTPSGTLMAIEPKYHHYTSNDPTSVETYRRDIKKAIDKMKGRYKRVKIIKHSP